MSLTTNFLAHFSVSLLFSVLTLAYPLPSSPLTNRQYIYIFIFFLFLFSIINNPTSQPELCKKDPVCLIPGTCYRKKWAGIAFARFLSREERIACVWPLHTYRFSWRVRIDRVQRSTLRKTTLSFHLVFHFRLLQRG